MINVEHPRESCTSLAWGLLCRRPPFLVSTSGTMVSLYLALTSAKCLGSFLIPLFPDDPEVMRKCMWDIVNQPVGEADAVRRKGSAGSAPTKWCRRVCSCPASETEPLTPKCWAWRTARQGDFNPTSVVLVLADFSPGRGQCCNLQVVGFSMLFFLALQFKFASCCLKMVCC